MKTTYNLIRFLLCGVLLFIAGAVTQKTYGEGGNSGMLINSNNAYSQGNPLYGMQINAFNSAGTAFAGESGLYYTEDMVATSYQPENFQAGKPSGVLVNNNTGGDPIITDGTKGGYSGCTIYKTQYLKGVLMPATKVKYNLYRFNSKGDPTEYIFYDLYSSKSNRETFTYNDGGKLIVQTTYFKNGAICDKTTYKYSTQGNLTEVNWYESGYLLLNRETYRYNTQNMVVEEVHYSGRDKVVGKDFYTYDEKGKLTQHKGMDGEGNVRDLDTYLYDAKNCLVEKKMQRNNPLAIHTFVYKYDAPGNLTMESELRVDKCAIKNAVYNYDINNKMVTHIVFSNNYAVKDTYSPIGNKMETSVTYKGIFNGKIAYTYDIYSNMISEIKFNNLNEPYELTDYVFY